MSSTAVPLSDVANYDLNVLRNVMPYAIPAVELNVRKPVIFKDMIESMAESMQGRLIRCPRVLGLARKKDN